METTVGSRVKALRKQKGLTQGELGDKLGTSAMTISSIENDQRESHELLGELAAFFKVSDSWLINGEGAGPKNIVVPIRKGQQENPWKDEAYQRLKEENQRLWKIVEHLTGGKAANFLDALTDTASALVIPISGKQAQVGAQA